MKKVILTSLFVATTLFATATIRYVKTGGTGDGSSWANASGDLQKMINESGNTVSYPDADEVWVAAGTYIPVRRADSAQYNHVYTPSNGDNAFVLKDNVFVYGGFAGNETELEQRDWNRYPTILDGKLSDAKYCSHVVIAAVGGESFFVLNGFIIQISPGNLQFEPYSDGSDSVMVNGYAIYRNWGNGITVCNSYPILENLIIRHCKGFGIYLENTSAYIGNTVIHANKGGIKCMNNSAPFINHVTITNNYGA
jgi:hypothetical protein